MTQPSIKYTTSPAIGDPALNFVWYFNHSPIKYRGGHGFVKALSEHPYIEDGPKATRFLIVNVYGDIDDENRYLGSANFPIRKLVNPSKKEFESAVYRHHAKQPSLKLTIKGWPNFVRYKPHEVRAPISSPIEKLFEIQPKDTSYGYASIACHNDFWGRGTASNPGAYATFAKIYPDMEKFSGDIRYSHDDLKYFRMPEWWFGSGYVVPGWMFSSFRPLSSMDLETFEVCLSMARDKANNYKKISNMTTEELSVMLGFYLTAYAHCVPYSYEMDPLEKKMPSEYFSPARLREMGDCEDTSWEVMQTFRELIEHKFPRGSELAVLQNFALGYTCFMTLGSATAAEAGAAGGASSKIMAHMYTLLIPNEYLERLNYKVENRATPAGLEILLVEGTGCVHPLQHPSSAFPPYITPRGKEFMDSALKKHKLKALRRFIYSPPSQSTDGVTAEFYLSVVSAISHNPADGMFAFMNGKGEVGVPLTDLFAQNVKNVRMACIPGTSTRHGAYKNDLQRAKLMLGFHEPVPKVYASAKTLPESGLIRLICANTKREAGTDHDAQFLMPMHYVNTEQERKAINHFRKTLHGFRGSQIINHSLGNSGAYLIRLWLK